MYAREHVLVTFLGDAWNAEEEWQFGLRLDNDTLPTTAQLTAISNAYATVHSHAAGFGFIGQPARFIGVKAAVIGADGRYPEGAQSVEVLRTPLAGGGPQTAPQLTLAVTLTTAVPRGRGSKGRFYLPSPSTGYLAQTDGRIAASNATTLITALETFVQGVNSAGAGLVTVFSGGQSVADPAPGPANVVTGLRLGRVIDTQRRRRGSLSEEYVSVPLA